MRNALSGLLTLAVLLAAGAAGFALYQHFGTSGHAAGGDSGLPSHRLAFSMPDLAGHVRPVSTWDGKTVLLNFWASWCGPCRQEMPLLVKAQRRYAAQGLQIVGIAIDSPGAARRFARSMHVDYPILVPRSQEKGISLAGAYGDSIGGLPYTVIYGPRGTVLAAHAGELHEAELEALIRKGLAHSER